MLKNNTGELHKVQFIWTLKLLLFEIRAVQNDIHVKTVSVNLTSNADSGFGVKLNKAVFSKRNQHIQ